MSGFIQIISAGAVLPLGPVHRGISISPMVAALPSGDWILATGNWNDGGEWDDAAAWID